MTFRVFRHPKLELILMIAAVVVLMAAFPIAAEPPFDRTEERIEWCAHYDALKQPFFGETHLHTAYSFDASTIDTRNTPRDAYHYAQGGKVGLPPWADTRTEADKMMIHRGMGHWSRNFHTVSQAITVSLRQPGQYSCRQGGRSTGRQSRTTRSSSARIISAFSWGLNSADREHPAVRDSPAP